MLEAACADLSEFAVTSMREQIGRPATAVVFRVSSPRVATSGGFARAVEAVEASGEPVGQTMRRHAIGDFGRADRETGGLPPGHCSRQFVRHLRTGLDNSGKV